MIKTQHAVRFVKLLKAWLGEGGRPVPKEVAQHRADTCRQCKKHTNQRWQEYVTGSVANLVKGQLEVKNKLMFHVEHEEELHTCGMCQCYLPLKVWVPLYLARNNTPDWQSFPDNCWIKNEQ